MSRRLLLLRATALLAVPSVLPARAAVPTELRIGVTPGPHAEIAAVVREVAAARGLALRLSVREGGAGIDRDVAAGTLDAASFQDAVAFAAADARQPLRLANVARTVTLPFAIYSRRLHALRELADGDRIAIPAEPAATARALLLLHNHGVLTLRDGSGLHATPRDVVARVRRIELSLRPGPALAAALPPCAAAVIDWANAGRAGWLPARDAIGIEDARSPYADILAVRSADQAAPWVAALVGAYHSPGVKRFLLERFQDSVRRPW